MTISADETTALRDATRRFLGAVTPASANEHVEATSRPLDRDGWRALADQLGLQGVGIPESLGGAGLGLEEELLVHEEMGRVVHGGPFLPTVGQVVPALVALDTEPARELLTSIAAGEEIVVPAHACWYDAGAEPCTATRDGDGVRVTGLVPSVLEPADADQLLVVAVMDGEPVLALVPCGDPGVEVLPLRAVDLTRRFADVRFADAGGTLLARGSAATRATEELETGAALALSAECVGVAAAAFELTVAYLKVREQFGQVIGAFQGLKHRAAELLVLLESARSALALAREAQSSPDTELRTAALAVARRRCGTAAFTIANEAIHLHGGIGFTWEHRVHLYYRRAKTNESLLDERGGQAQVLAASVRAMYARESAGA